MAHLKANLVLYQSCKYELPNILNGGRVLDRIQHDEGGGGETKSTGKKCIADNFAKIGATDLIYASFNSLLTEL